MKDVKCKFCIEYKGNWCDKKRDDPDPDMVRDCQWFRTMTNADAIRAMTDEELANFLISTCPQHGQQCNDPFYDCVACWLDWLKQEVSDGSPKD